MKSSDVHDMVPEELRGSERSAWLAYGDAVLMGRPVASRRRLFRAAMRETDACLVVVREARDRQAGQKAAA